MLKEEMQNNRKDYINSQQLSSFRTSTIMNLSLNETELPSTLPEELYPTLTVIYLFIFVIGIIGNSLVILVIIKDKKMRSVANFFLVSLSAADLMIILFCLPVAVYELYNSYDWIFGLTLCKLTPYLQYLSVNASMLTMLAISFERLFVICVPLKARSWCTKRRTLIVLICIWVICAVTSFPAFLFTTIVQGYDESINVNITMCITQTNGHEWYLICQSVLFYIFPGFLLLVIYAIIIKSLRTCPIQSTLQTNNISRKISRKRENRQQLILMLGVVVIAYFICLLPFNVIVLLAIISPQKLHFMDPNEYTILLSATRVLFFINSCINPILYNAISGKFRAAFVRFFRLKWKKDAKSLDSSEYKNINGSCRDKQIAARKSVVSELSHEDNSYCSLLKNGKQSASVEKIREQLL